MKKFCSFLCLLIGYSFCNAQTEGYQYYSRLDSVPATGFYNIVLKPFVTARLKADYSDVRIVDEAGKWVPHLLRFTDRDITAHKVNFDVDFEVSKNNSDSTVVVAHTGPSTLNNLGLTTRNTAAVRYASLSGSDDKLQWFTINDSIVISPTAGKGLTQVFDFYFPPANYQYYKINIVNKGSDPYSIENVITRQVTGPDQALKQMIVNPVASIQQKDSARFSYIRVTQAMPFHFTEIGLQLRGQSFFYRKAVLYIAVAEAGGFQNMGHPVATFTLSNNSTLRFNTGLQNANVFFIVIDNEDNPPLSIDTVSTYLPYRFISAHLEAGRSYRLFMGNKNAKAPEYDLPAIDSLVPYINPTLNAEAIIATESATAAAGKNKFGTGFMWVAIFAALMLLLFFTRHILQEVNKKSDDHI